MRKNVKDIHMPIGPLKEVKDFLPPPEELIFPEEDTIKVTLALKRSSVEFFKRQAHKNHTKYQRMIRELVDRYVNMHNRGK